MPGQKPGISAPATIPLPQSSRCAPDPRFLRLSPFTSLTSLNKKPGILPLLTSKLSFTLPFCPRYNPPAAIFPLRPRSPVSAAFPLHFPDLPQQKTGDPPLDRRFLEKQPIAVDSAQLELPVRHLAQHLHHLLRTQ